MITVSCTRKQRENRIVHFYNYSLSTAINIETEGSFLSDHQFNQAVFDTSKLYLFDRNISMQLIKAINKLEHEISVLAQNEEGKELFANTNLKEDSSYFFLLGKLNIHTDINSLITMESDRSFGDEISGLKLWLFNIKDNCLCSIVLLGCFYDINTFPCPSICVKNKTFTMTKTESNYFLIQNFGERFRLKDKEYFSTFTIDDNGFLKFTK